MSSYQFKCTAVRDHITIIDNLVEMLLSANGVTETKRFCFAVHELVINSVEAMQKTACMKGADQIVIRLRIDEEVLEFTINDWGGGLPAEVYARLHTEESGELSMDESGRGISMIRMFIDEFIYFKESDGSCTYQIIKRRMDDDKNAENQSGGRDQ